MEITFLGSGAASPTADRNTSGLYVKHQGTVILLDCGEGTLRQILSLGLSPDLDALCLTHDHTDHVIGLVGLLRQMRLSGRTRPLRIFGHAAALAKIEKLTSFEVRAPDEFIIDTQTISAGTQVDQGSILITPFATTHRVPSLGFRLDGAPLRPKIDQDKARALGILPGPLMGQLQRGQVVTLANGQQVAPEQVLMPPRPGPSLVYTGDTLPSDLVATASIDTDVLIHDSTYLAKDAAKAVLHAHSTATEAAQIAAASGAKSLVLTHISARYDQVECALFVPEAAQVFKGPIFLAEDGFALDVSTRSSLVRSPARLKP